MPPKDSKKKKKTPQLPRRSSRVEKLKAKEYEADCETDSVPEEEEDPKEATTEARVQALEGGLRSMNSKLDLILNAHLQGPDKPAKKKKKARVPGLPS